VSGNATANFKFVKVGVHANQTTEVYINSGPWQMSRLLNPEHFKQTPHCDDHAQNCPVAEICNAALRIGSIFVQDKSATAGQVSVTSIVIPEDVNLGGSQVTDNRSLAVNQIASYIIARFTCPFGTTPSQYRTLKRGEVVSTNALTEMNAETWKKFISQLEEEEKAGLESPKKTSSAGNEPKQGASLTGPGAGSDHP
jgi:hypothetical protein